MITMRGSAAAWPTGMGPFDTLTSHMLTSNYEETNQSALETGQHEYTGQQLVALLPFCPGHMGTGKLWHRGLCHCHQDAGREGLAGPGSQTGGDS